MNSVLTGKQSLTLVKQICWIPIFNTSSCQRKLFLSNLVRELPSSVVRGALVSSSWTLLHRQGTRASHIITWILSFMCVYLVISWMKYYLTPATEEVVQICTTRQSGQHWSDAPSLLLSLDCRLHAEFGQSPCNFSLFALTYPSCLGPIYRTLITGDRAPADVVPAN